MAAPVTSPATPEQAPAVPVHTLVQSVAQTLLHRKFFLATAESCTGGLIAAACTALPGASQWFERGFVSYSNASKVQLLGVPWPLIEQHGAVSQQTAQAMARGAAQQAQAHVAVAVTGVAGPEGGSAHTPVGTVCFGFALPGQLISRAQYFAGDRNQIRQASVHFALQTLHFLLLAHPP